MSLYQEFNILEGSVRRAGDQVRITAQLIRADDNAHLWSQNFDRDASDVIRVQEEIAYEIARTLQTALDPDELEQMVSAGTNSIAAHEALLRYRHLESRAVELEDWSLILEALEALEAARSLDPQFHRAHLAAADFWRSQLEPTTRMVGVTGLPYGERETRALDALRAAWSWLRRSPSAIGSGPRIPAGGFSCGSDRCAPRVAPRKPRRTWHRWATPPRGIRPTIWWSAGTC